MIDFACKQFNIEEIIKCSLGLTKAEFEIFRFMLEHSEEYNTQDISKKKNLELSTVQRTLKKLVDKEVVHRRQINLEQGGYIYVYSIKNKKAIREKINSLLKDWSIKVEKELNSWCNK